MSCSVGKSIQGSKQSAKSVLDTLNLISSQPKKNNIKTLGPKSEPVKVAQIHKQLGGLGTVANSIA